MDLHAMLLQLESNIAKLPFRSSTDCSLDHELLRLCDVAAVEEVVGQDVLGDVRLAVHDRQAIIPTFPANDVLLHGFGWLA